MLLEHQEKMKAGKVIFHRRLQQQIYKFMFHSCLILYHHSALVLTLLGQDLKNQSIPYWFWCADEINVNFEVNLLSFRVLFFERKAKYCKLLTSHFKFQDNCKLKLFLRKLVGPNWENNKLLSSRFFFSDTISETIAQVFHNKPAFSKPVPYYFINYSP